MLLKMEVGKQYQHEVTKSIFTCIAVNETQAVLDGTSGFTVFWHTETHKFKEYKEPEKRTVWFNIYEGMSYFKYPSKERADQSAGRGRIGRICVELVEGQFDE